MLFGVSTRYNILRRCSLIVKSKLIKDLGIFLIAVAAAVLASVLFDAWYPPPTVAGCDTPKLIWMGLTEARQPFLRWNHQWYAGTVFPAGYPWGGSLILGLFVKVIGNAWLTVLFLQILAVAGIAFACSRLARQMGGGFAEEVFTAIAVALAPEIWTVHVYSGVSYEIWGIPLALFGLYLLLKDHAFTKKRAVYSGLLLGAAVWIHPATIFWLLPFTIVILKHADRVGWKRAVSGLLLLLVTTFAIILPYLTWRFAREPQLGGGRKLLPKLGRVSATRIVPFIVPLPILYLIGQKLQVYSYITPGLALAPILVISLCVADANVAKSCLKELRKNSTYLLLLNSAVMVVLLCIWPLYPFNIGKCAAIAAAVIISPLYIVLLAKTLYWKLGSRRIVLEVLLVLIISLGVLPILIQKQPYIPITRNSPGQIAEISKVTKNMHMYRIAVSETDRIRAWMNVYTTTPQTSGYLLGCIAYMGISYDFYYWFDTHVFRRKWPQTRVHFALDWWGVRWVVASPQWGKDLPFVKEVEEYQNPRRAVFEVRDASPIVLGGNSNLVLVVGSPFDYFTAWDTIAMANKSDSYAFILVYGGESLPSAEDFEKFDALLLIQPTVEQLWEWSDSISDFLNRGGCVFVEVGSWSYLAYPLPEWMPATLAKPLDLEDVVSTPDGWEGIWHIVCVPEDALVGGAEVVLRTQSGYSVIVQRRYGEGMVIMSGLNLFYIAQMRQSMFLANIAYNIFLKEAWCRADIYNIVPLNFTLERNTIHIHINKSLKYVLVKENFFSTWRAVVSLGKEERELSIWKAGPFFMLVVLRHLGVVRTLTLRYTMPWWEATSYIITVVYITLLLSTENERIREKLKRVLQLTAKEAIVATIH